MDSNPAPANCGRTPVPATHVNSCLFRSNSCPSPETCNNIKSLIVQHECQLAAIQGQVDRLRTCLADMERLEVQTKDALVKLYATLTPIKRLPPEILAGIFEQCLDTMNLGVPFSITARNKETLLVLGRVCRSWRTIVRATPRLWRDIFVNVCDSRYSAELRRDALPMLQTWIAYSGTLPLNLVVLCKTEQVLPGLTDLFETIAAHAVRWKTVQVRLQNSPVIYMFVCRTFSKCTSLSTFDVTDGGQCASFFASRQQDKDAEPIRFDLSFAPLDRLSLSLAGLTLRDVHVHWATLTRLSFMQDARSSTTSITDYANILRQCMLLKECGITIGSGIREAPLAPFTLPSLECLEIQMLQEATQTAQMGDIVSVLDAPRLRALVIEDYCLRAEVVSYHSQLKAFLRAHAQSLRHLRYSTASKFFTAEDFVTLIVETPLLMELEYHPDEESSPRALLEALTPRVEGDVVECLLAHLERFCVFWDTTETVSKVGDMTEKRHTLVERGIARLTHLSCRPVRYDRMPPHTPVENLAARLEPLRRCGLQVDWAGCRHDVEWLDC